MASIPDQAAEAWNELVAIFYPQTMVTGATTTFTLYRKDGTGTTTALGTEKPVWRVVVAAVPCTYVGTREQEDDHFYIHRQGKAIEEYAEMVTAYDDVKEGDNVVIALDNRTYHVEVSTPMGAIQWCELNLQKAQIR
jgi:hypothetical protein